VSWPPGNMPKPPSPTGLADVQPPPLLGSLARIWTFLRDYHFHSIRRRDEDVARNHRLDGVGINILPPHLTSLSCCKERDAMIVSSAPSRLISWRRLPCRHRHHRWLSHLSLTLTATALPDKLPPTGHRTVNTVL
jgi:hypothetical protein